MAKIPIKTVNDDEKSADVAMNDQEMQQENAISSDAEREDIHMAEAEQEGEAEAAKEASDEEVAEEQIAPEQVSSEIEEEEQDEAEEPEDEITWLTKQLHAKEQETKEHYEARLRLQAEFDNFKKRQEKELVSFRKYAHENLIQDILPIVDDFERAIAAAEQTHKLEDFLEGVELIFSKFQDVLQKKGVKEIEAAEGQPFNPEIHEAMTQIETNDVEEGAIVLVFQKGYYLHDRVIRASKVGVAKKKE